MSNNLLLTIILLVLGTCMIAYSFLFISDKLGKSVAKKYLNFRKKYLNPSNFFLAIVLELILYINIVNPERVFLGEMKAKGVFKTITGFFMLLLGIIIFLSGLICAGIIH